MKNLPTYVIAISSLLLVTSAQAQQSISYTYNSNGQVLTEDGARTDVADITTYSYNPEGLLSSQTNAQGQVITYSSYDASGNLLSVTDANGVVTEFTYDLRNRLTSVLLRHPTDASKNSLTSYTYDAVGQMLSTTLPDGTQLFYEYDDARRLVAVTNAANERIEYILDAAGNITQEVIKNASQQTLYRLERNFDELSRVRSLLSGVGQTTGYAYDVNDNVKSMTDGRSATTTYDFDALDQLKSEKDPLLKTTGFGYDANGRISSVTDAKGLVTSYVYNGFGELVQQTSPDSGVTTFAYDEAGNRVLSTDARGVQTHYHYDALNRLTLAEYPSNTALNQHYTYDQSGAYSVGQLTETQDVSGVTYYGYDYLGNVTSKHYTVDGNAYAQLFQYDSAGRLASITYPSGRLVHYSYDGLSRVQKISTQAHAQAPMVTVVDQVTYLPFGPVKGWSYGNGLRQERNFDLAYRLTGQSSLGATLATDANYDYDGSGNIKAIDALLNPAASQAFVYDLLNRVTSASGSYGALSYSYDAVGNRLSRSHNQQQETYSYPMDSHRLASVTSSLGPVRNFDYDSNGNMIADTRSGGLQWQYDAQNRPAQIQVAGLQVSYLHNLLGQRVLKQSHSGTQIFHYGLDGKLLAVNNAFGAVTEEHIWLADIEVGSLLGSGSSLGYADLFVLAPEANTEVLYGTNLEVTASATDNGQDISAAITWSSDMDGPIGSGGSPSFSNLSVGTHLLTAQVVSASGKVTKQQRLVRVKPSTTQQPASLMFNPIQYAFNSLVRNELFTAQ